MMQWALLNVATKTLKTGHWDEDNRWVEEFIEEPAGTIFNIIVYDGMASYTPPADYTLVEVADDKKIGDFIGL